MDVLGIKNDASSAKNTRTLVAFLLKVLPLVAFVGPLTLLYLFNPLDTSLNVSAQQSFELMWKGRTFHLFFIWLIALEFILSWETVTSKINLQNKPRVAAYAVALLLPALYVLWEFSGLNGAIAGWSLQSGVAFAGSMPLAIEYLVFSVNFLLMVFLSFGKKGLVKFILPGLFLAMVGFIYSIDNMFPYGEFTPFQLLVPTTASLAAGVLNLMGYTTIPGVEAATGMPTLEVSSQLGTATFAIAWPCAGIESLLIFTAVALLFLKRMNLSWKSKIGFFAIGAGITYFINVLRIATIFTIGVEYGAYSEQVNQFHYYYGPLYAMAWIVSYPLLIILCMFAWQKIRKPQSTTLSPV